MNLETPPETSGVLHSQTGDRGQLYRNQMGRDIAGSFLAAASSLGSRLVGNDQLAGEFGVSEEWIESRCGVKRRRVAGDETAISLGAEAARMALASNDVKPDLLLCATYSPERLLTPIAPAIATKAGLGNIAGFDLNAGCSGGLTAFLSGLAYLSSGLFQKVLIVATDTTTKYLRTSDLATRMLFSDGAVAILLAPPKPDSRTFRVRAHRFGSDGTGIDLFSASWGAREGLRPHVVMEGRALFRFAVEAGVRTLTELCSDAKITPACLNRVLIHQANARITRAIQESFPVPRERWPDSQDLGNLAGASVLFLLARELSQCPPVPGELIALVAFGAGLTWVGTILEFGPCSGDDTLKSVRSESAGLNGHPRQALNLELRIP